MSRPARIVALVCVIGLALTATSAWAAHRADRGTEERLLDIQTRQAAAVLTAAIGGVLQPLTTALQVQATAGPAGDPALFRRTFAPHLDDAAFVSASLWKLEGSAVTRVASVGVAPGLDPAGDDLRRFLDRAADRATPVVTRVDVGERTRIGYALADPELGLVVYSERAIAADRRSRVEGDSAFSEIHYAIYLGDQLDPEDLTTTDVDPADLPLDGLTSTTTVPFADTVLTLVTAPSGHLGSPLSRWLPAILLLSGLLLTAATALVARQLVGARIRAEEDSATINELYQRINGLYQEQRGLFVRLQRALLPHVNPDVPQFEIASKYVAGAEGVEIGGDWYSIIAVGEDHFGFVVGDVSGRGVDAVAEMARARFTLRAYLVDGNTPAQALEKCSRQFDVTLDEHIVTVIVGLGAWRSGEIVLANAGHPLPLLVTADRAEPVPVPVGPPLGVGASSYATATLTMPPGSTLIGYTDGLVERRGEDIDAGLARLVAAAVEHGSAPVADLLTRLLESLREEGAADDIALLALRRSVRAGGGTDH